MPDPKLPAAKSSTSHATSSDTSRHLALIQHNPVSQLAPEQQPDLYTALRTSWEALRPVLDTLSARLPGFQMHRSLDLTRRDTPAPPPVAAMATHPTPVPPSVQRARPLPPHVTSLAAARPDVRCLRYAPEGAITLDAFVPDLERATDFIAAELEAFVASLDASRAPERPVPTLRVVFDLSRLVVRAPVALAPPPRLPVPLPPPLPALAATRPSPPPPPVRVAPPAASSGSALIPTSRRVAVGRA